jgi:putative FmdB family regulatory protein
MPTYEYKCDACEHQFEQFQSIKADPLRKCPQCGKNKLRRLIGTGAGLLFKGSGFYITDYRSESYKSKASSESGSGAKPAESKPAASGSPAPSGSAPSGSGAGGSSSSSGGASTPSSGGKGSAS